MPAEGRDADRESGHLVTAEKVSVPMPEASTGDALDVLLGRSTPASSISETASAIVERYEVIERRYRAAAVAGHARARVSATTNG